MSGSPPNPTLSFLQFRIQYSSLALLYYDYALTFPSEVKHMWRGKRSLSTILYVFCRYALVANLLYLLAIANKLCDTWYKIIGALSVLGRAAIITTFTLRTYVIFGQNTFILLYLGAVGLACVALDITHVPGLRCVGSSTNTLLSILMVVFEYSSAILLTIRAAQVFKVRKQRKMETGNDLVSLILEQGLFVISFFTTAAVVLNFRAPSGFFQRLLNALTLPLSCLLTARFLLHLREFERRRLEGTNYSQQRTLAGFEAASGSGAISTMMDDFGDDPLAGYSDHSEPGPSGQV
ncbi:hypothetical protein C8J56DRAFT_1007731 [Mycena floridula]|nr:hypothetical protein C8J56DRAFT_1007731 [Mycena floridula]